MPIPVDVGDEVLEFPDGTSMETMQAFVDERRARKEREKRFKPSTEIAKEVRANPSGFTSKLAFGAEALANKIPQGLQNINPVVKLGVDLARGAADFARTRADAEIKARTGQPGEQRGAVMSLLHGMTPKGMAEAAGQLDAAVFQGSDLRPGQSFTRDEQMGRVAQGIGGALGVTGPLGLLSAGGALKAAGQAGLALAAKEGTKAGLREAAKQTALSTARGGAILAAGAAGGALASAGAKAAGAGPGGQALAEMAGGVAAGGAVAPRLARSSKSASKPAPAPTSAPAPAPTPAAPGTKTAGQLENDAIRAETHREGPKPGIRAQVDKATDWLVQTLVNPEHELSKAERKAGAAGALPVNARTGEPLATVLPTTYLAQSRRSPLAVLEELRDHPVSRELRKLGSKEMMDAIGEPGDSTTFRGSPPLLRRFEKWLLSKMELEERQHRGREHPSERVDEKGNKYTPTWEEIEAQVAERAPQFEPIAKALYDYRDKAIREKLVDSGLMSPGEYQHYRETYSNYVPAQRAFPDHESPYWFDPELKPQPVVKSGPGVRGADPLTRPKEADNQRQAVDVVANVLHQAYRAQQAADANKAGRLFAGLGKRVDEKGNVIQEAKPGYEGVTMHPIGVEVKPGRGEGVIRVYVNGRDAFHDVTAPEPIVQGLRNSIKSGLPDAVNRTQETVTGLMKLGMTGLSPGFALVGNPMLAVGEIASKSRGGAVRSLTNVARYTPEWLISRAIPRGVEMRGPVGKKLGEMRANPDSLLTKVMGGDTEPLPGRILRDGEGNIEGVNLTAAFDLARKKKYGGAQGAMLEGSPEATIDSLINPAQRPLVWTARTAAHPLEKLKAGKDKLLHVTATDELFRIAAARSTQARLRKDRVREPDGTLRPYTEEELIMEGARDGIESLTDFTKTTPLIRWLGIAGAGLFINPALQSTRIHAKGLAGHRGAEARNQELRAMMLGALGGYVATTQNLSDPQKREAYRQIGVRDRTRGWVVVDDQQKPSPGPYRVRGIVVSLDGPARIGADMGRMAAEMQYGRGDKESALEARKFLTRAGENLTGINAQVDENWLLETGMLILKGLRPDGRPVATGASNAAAHPVSANLARILDTEPARVQAVGQRMVPLYGFALPADKRNDPFAQGSIFDRIGLGVKARLTTIPRSQSFENRKEVTQERRKTAGTKP